MPRDTWLKDTAPHFAEILIILIVIFTQFRDRFFVIS